MGGTGRGVQYNSSVGGYWKGVQYNSSVITVSECFQMCAMLTFPELEVG